MEKENSVTLKPGEVPGRTNRARAAAPLTEFGQSRGVLQDATNFCYENTSKVQAKKINDLTKPAQLNILRTVAVERVVDIDADTDFDATDLYNNLRFVELSTRPHSNFMETVQHHITPRLRAALIDWLVEVCEKYELLPETLYLTVYLIDLFLSTNNIEKNRFPLLGITCLLLASKYEEIDALCIEDLSFKTRNYTKEEVLKMELQVLNSSGYQLFAPTTNTFLRRFLQAAQASYTNPTLEHYASYKASDLRTSILELQKLQQNRNDCLFSRIRTKYRQHKFNNVAVLRSPEVLESLFRR